MVVRPQCPPEAKETRRPKTVRDLPPSKSQYRSVSRNGKGPERAASLSLWLYAAIWTWYIPNCGTTITWIMRPWYQKKTVPSFLDALATLRRFLWSERISAMSSDGPLNPKIIDGLLDVLTRAA